jgi:predicted nucleotidyltransferase component of viral defense system
MKELKSLLPKTREVLTGLSKLPFMQSFVWVGGSALAVYLDHRLSEDLDFFTNSKELDKRVIMNNIRSVKGFDLIVMSESKTQIDIIINEVNITFFSQKWEELEHKEKVLDHISIAPLELLTVMKVNTLFLRARHRDYYDLYVLNKEKYSLKEMYTLSLKILPGISIKLFQNALVFISDIEDESIKHLKPKYKVTLKKISSEFKKNISSWLNER